MSFFIISTFKLLNNYAIHIFGEIITKLPQNNPYKQLQLVAAGFFIQCLQRTSFSYKIHVALIKHYSLKDYRRDWLSDSLDGDE